MYLDKVSIKSLAKIIAGDITNSNLLYRTGRNLVDLFNQYGSRDIYEAGFPSRCSYVEEKLDILNGTKELEYLILQIIDERNFLDCEFDNSDTLEVINKTIKYNKYKIIKSNDSYLIEGDLISDDPVSIAATFKQIQNKLISELEKSKYIIMAAVAWITDDKVYEVLKRKKDSGVTVKLIICDDDTNKNSGLNYDIFETYRMPKYGRLNYNIMHNKFCIVDLKTVLEGSYNWTKSADYHKEQFVTITNYSNAEEFADRFVELRDQIVNKTY